MYSDYMVCTSSRMSDAAPGMRKLRDVSPASFEATAANRNSHGGHTTLAPFGLHARAL